MPPSRRRAADVRSASASGAGDSIDPSSEHGAHTLKVWTGRVEGVYGDDVFVELGPRMQGVISVRELDERPRIGDEYRFTLRGREEDLWVLALAPDGVLEDWEDMEPGTQVLARVVRRNFGGFEAKVGPLHAFLPISHCGVPKEGDPDVLLGKTVPCEVIEVDPERQRVVLSHKLVLQRARRSSHEKEVGGLEPGQLVQGRVSRIEDYGAFVRFGRGLEGLLHVSNLSHERVGHPSEVLEKGQHVEARILSIRAKGKRIALGLKQLTPSPWVGFAQMFGPGDLVRGTVTHLYDFGARVRVATGVEGLVHRSELEIAADQHLGDALAVGRDVVVRILAIDVEGERMSLSRLAAHGPTLTDEDLVRPEEAREPGPGHLSIGLGGLLRRALGDGSTGDGAAGGDVEPLEGHG